MVFAKPSGRLDGHREQMRSPVRVVSSPFVPFFRREVSAPSATDFDPVGDGESSLYRLDPSPWRPSLPIDVVREVWPPPFLVSHPAPPFPCLTVTFLGET